MNSTEERLTNLRSRIRGIRIAKQWLDSYQIVAPPQVSSALGSYYKWLNEQEQQTMKLGKKIKAQSEEK